MASPTEEIIEKVPEQGSSDTEPPNKKVKRPRVKKLKGSLNSLPPEMVLEIMEYLPKKDVLSVRATSRRYRDITTLFIKNKYNVRMKEINDKQLTDSCSGSLKTINFTTELFHQSGFEFLLYNCYMPMMERPINITKFLSNYFGYINAIGGTSVQHCRLLYTMSLVRVIMKFKTAVLTSSETKALHWRAIVEITGPWMGLLWSRGSVARDQWEKRNDLIVLLAEMLMVDQTDEKFKKVWDKINEVYIIGNGSIFRKNPKTIFKLTVHGNKKICSIFNAIVHGTYALPAAPHKWPGDEFTLSVDVYCKEAARWGCHKYLQFEFGPFAEVVPSDDDD